MTMKTTKPTSMADAKQWHGNPPTQPVEYVTIAAGVDCEYQGHVPGGYVAVRVDGRDLISMPSAFAELAA